MNIVWRPRAAGDFETLIAASSAANVGHASRDKSLVETRIQQLIRFDQLGRKTRRQGVRELSIDGTPYVVVSKRIGEEILILRMFSNGSPIQNR
jgi:plasmid stabilization system protein ParE